MEIKREPYLPIERRAKADGIGNLNQKVFISFFIQEVALRERRGRSQMLGPTIESKYSKLLNRVANMIWDSSKQSRVSCANLTFIFLNRYYAFFIKKNPLNKMAFFWDEFLIELSHQQELIDLLNYDDSMRENVCTIIKELKEGYKSNAFKKFLQDKVNGYNVIMPEHDLERSELFETILIMLNQIEKAGLYYYKNNHALEILKAHVLELKKFGNPIKMHLGHFIGDNALRRLQNYFIFVNKKSFGGFAGDTF